MKQSYILKPFLSWGLCLLLTCLVSLSYGQRRYSVSAGAGASYYYGDLTNGFNARFLRPVGTVSFSTYLYPTISMRFSLSYGQVGAADSLSDDPNRRARNLHFWSPITEVSGLVVYEILPDRHFGRWRGRGRIVISPYIFGGAAIYRFDPRAQVNDQFWMALQPLGTEGQFTRENISAPLPYQLTQVAIPLGAGVEMRFSPNLGMRLELGYRTTFTDYLDDISTFYPDESMLLEASGQEAVSLSYRGTGDFPAGAPRGSPAASDSYVFTTFSLVYYIPNN